jgi:hypothetical protein
MEFKMSAFTKLASVAITVTLGIASNVPLSNPALSASSKSTSAEHVAHVSRQPVVDFGLYYGPHIEFRHSKEGDHPRHREEYALPCLADRAAHRLIA